jgi:hypothetical protein
MKSVVSALCVGVTLFSLALAATACNKAGASSRRTALAIPASQVTAAATPAKAETPAAEEPQPGDAATVEGYYVGMFVAEKMDENKHPMASNKINLSIDSMDGDKVTGHSVVAGTSTPFTGTIEAEKKDVYNVKITESPGKDNGTFTAVLNTSTKTISGTWVASSKTAAVTERSYELVKTQFKYNPRLELGETWSELYDTQDPERDQYEAITDAAGKLNASAKLLKTKDVDNMYKRDLEVVRNAIYARHGYTFRNRQMRYFFDNYIDWYVPVSTNVTAELTDIENKNIALLKRYEKHANKYYDSYGR